MRAYIRHNPPTALKLIVLLEYFSPVMLANRPARALKDKCTLTLPIDRFFTHHWIILTLWMAIPR